MAGRVLLIVAAWLTVLVVAGCGGGSNAPISSSIYSGTAQPGENCGQTAGVPGEIVVLQRPMKCREAFAVAHTYFKSDAAPGRWRQDEAGANHYTRGWECGPRLYGNSGIQCVSYASGVAAQSRLSRASTIK